MHNNARIRCYTMLSTVLSARTCNIQNTSVPEGVGDRLCRVQVNSEQVSTQDIKVVIR